MVTRLHESVVPHFSTCLAAALLTVTNTLPSRVECSRRSLSGSARGARQDARAACPRVRPERRADGLTWAPPGPSMAAPPKPWERAGAAGRTAPAAPVTPSIPAAAGVGAATASAVGAYTPEVAASSSTALSAGATSSMYGRSSYGGGYGSSMYGVGGGYGSSMYGGGYGGGSMYGRSGGGMCSSPANTCRCLSPR